MKTNIGVFFGGRSTEHEISVISASQAMAAINRDKYDVTPIYISKQVVHRRLAVRHKELSRHECSYGKVSRGVYASYI